MPGAPSAAIFRALAKEQFVSRVVSFFTLLLGERTLYLHPLDGIAGHAVFRRQRVDVLFAGAIHPRAKQAGTIRRNDLPGPQQDRHLGFCWLGRKVELPDHAALPGALRKNAHRFMGAARPDFIQVQPVPERQVIDRCLFVARSFVIPADAAAMTRSCIQTQTILPRDRGETVPAIAPASLKMPRPGRLLRVCEFRDSRQAAAARVRLSR
jgi:hypothetical protein